MSGMENNLKVHVKTTNNEYNVIIGENLHYGKLLSDCVSPRTVMLVSDDTVFALYGEKAIKELEECGFQVFHFAFPHGEKSKTMDTVTAVLEYAVDCGLTRKDMFAALGGGVVGDLTGFAAAIYQRGVPFVQFPTTLLAAIDSSVGGKTAVDLPNGKNLVGSFHQPVGVFCDIKTFDTLPEEVFDDGMAEAVKYGMIWDAELMQQFEDMSFDLASMVQRCVEIKAEVVGTDEFELGLRKILNFGHTVGHAIETLSQFSVGHGSAVAIGMVIVTRAQEEKYGIDTSKPESMTQHVIKALKNYNLPISCEYGCEEIANLAKADKKREGKEINVIVPKQIGKVDILKMTMDEWKEFLERDFNLNS